MIMLHAGLAVSLNKWAVSFTWILSNCNAPVFLFILSWQENKKPLTESIIASRLTYCFFIPVFSINSTFVLSFTIDKYRWNSWIGLIKTEMYYKHEFTSAEHLMREIEEYIDYYNNRRIKCKLKGLSPVQYRIQSNRVA